MISCITPRIDVEDAGSLIAFIDHFVPQMNRSDPDTNDTVENVLKVRKKFADTLKLAGYDIPELEEPVNEPRNT